MSASGHERLQIDVTCAARDTDHAERLVQAMAGVPGVVIGKVSDRTFPDAPGRQDRDEQQAPDPHP